MANVYLEPQFCVDLCQSINQALLLSCLKMSKKLTVDLLCHLNQHELPLKVHRYRKFWQQADIV